MTIPNQPCPDCREHNRPCRTCLGSRRVVDDAAVREQVLQVFSDRIKAEEKRLRAVAEDVIAKVDIRGMAREEILAEHRRQSANEAASLGISLPELVARRQAVFYRRQAAGLVAGEESAIAARRAGMEAENQLRAARGESPAYGGEAFAEMAGAEPSPQTGSAPEPAPIPGQERAGKCSSCGGVAHSLDTICRECGMCERCAFEADKQGDGACAGCYGVVLPLPLDVKWSASSPLDVRIVCKTEDDAYAWGNVSGIHRVLRLDRSTNHRLREERAAAIKRADTAGKCECGSPAVMCRECGAECDGRCSFAIFGRRISDACIALGMTEGKEIPVDFIRRLHRELTEARDLAARRMPGLCIACMGDAGDTVADYQKHIKTCPAHPMRAVESELTEALALSERLSGELLESKKLVALRDGELVAARTSKPADPGREPSAISGSVIAAQEILNLPGITHDWRAVKPGDLADIIDKHAKPCDLQHVTTADVMEENAILDRAEKAEAELATARYHLKSRDEDVAEALGRRDTAEADLATERATVASLLAGKASVCCFVVSGDCELVKRDPSARKCMTCEMGELRATVANMRAEYDRQGGLVARLRDENERLVATIASGKAAALTTVAKLGMKA